MELYHYSNENFETFDNNLKGTSTDDGVFGEGFYFWDDYNIAELYCNKFGKYIYIVEIDVSKFYTFDLSETLNSLESLNEICDCQNLIDYFNENEEIESCEFLITVIDLTKKLSGLGYTGVKALNREGLDCSEYCVFDSDSITINEVIEN